jgi:DNA-binding transcriptional ArsR family regulator
MQSALAVVDGPEPAASILKPARRRILEHLREPDSASGVAHALGLPRQRVGYHVRQLEKQGLIRAVGERRKGNFIERLLQTTARQYLIGPTALGPLGARPDRIRDRFSGDYLVAVAAQTMRDVGVLQERASQTGKLLATLTLQTEVRFANPQDQNSFAQELTESLTQLAGKYHRPDAEGGRTFRLVVGGYPSPPNGEGEEESRRTEDEVEG